MDLEKKQILEVTIKSIINTIKDLGFSEEEFLGKSRKMPLPDLRAIAVHYAQNNIFRKTEIIKEDACVIFNRHRTSMFNHAYKKCSDLLEVDEDFKKLYYRFASLFDRHISDENIFIGEDCDYSLSSIQNQYAKKYLYNNMVWQY